MKCEHDWILVGKRLDTGAPVEVCRLCKGGKGIDLHAADRILPAAHVSDHHVAYDLPDSGINST